MSGSTSQFTVSDSGMALAYADVTDWGNGYQSGLSITAKNGQSINGGWTMTFTLDADIDQIWGAVIDSHVGDTYTISNVWYDATITAGAPAEFGYVTTGDSQPVASSFVLNGTTLSTGGGSSTPPTTPTTPTTTPSTPTTTPTPPSTPTTTPTPPSTPTTTPTPPTTPATPPASPPSTPTAAPVVQLSNIQVNVGTANTFAAAGSGTLLPSGYLSTDGGQIVDANGTPVQINAINWWGFETLGAPQGLDLVNYKATMQQMVSLGFNTIRLPFSLAALDSGMQPEGINYALNPDLQGLSVLGVMDKIIAEAGALGMKVILDDHSAELGGLNNSGLWYDSTYNQADFTNTWTMLAQHYAGNSTVVGFDLSNEPHSAATWGDGNPATDWHLAATQIADTLQAIDPGALEIAEGVETYNGIDGGWGSNLMGVATDPITLNEPGKLVYSAHAYPYEITGASYDLASNYPSNLAAIWTQTWGYVQQQNIAPVFVGEFGSDLETQNSQTWISTFQNYIAGNAAAGTGSTVPQTPFNWGYWDWNPIPSDPLGILENDWTTVDSTTSATVEAMLWHPTDGASVDALFTITLSAAATTATVLHVSTLNGTAIAGVDYTALSENVTIAAGDTQVQVGVQLLDPSGQTSNRSFSLVIDDASGNLIGTETATLVNNGSSPTTPPTTPTTPPTTPTTPPTTPTTPPTTPTTPPAPAQTVVILGGQNNVVNGPSVVTTPTGVTGTNITGPSTGNATLTGTADNITITAYGANNTIVAGGGNDTINAGGNGARVTVSNTNANNSVSGGTGATTINLGDGNNSLVIGGTSDNVTLGNGNNTLSVGTGSATIVVGNGNNTITTTGNGNTITVGTGTNTINAGASGNNITIDGGSATVTVSGSSDTITLASSFGTSGSLDITGLGTGSLMNAGSTWTIDTATGSAYASIHVVSGSGLVDKSDGHGGMLITETGVPAVPPTTPTTEQASVSVGVVADWVSGLQESLTITNTGTTAINGWQLELDTTQDVTGIWNAGIVSQNATTTVIGNVSYNGSIAAGASVTVGLLANHVNPGDAMTAHVLSLS